MTTPTTHKRPRIQATLERQAIGFTISLYLFISESLLALHYLAPLLPQATAAETPATANSSVTHTTDSTDSVDPQVATARNEQ